MAPLTNFERTEMLAELQRLVDEFERIVCQQSGCPDGNFHDIIETTKRVVLSKKDNKALNAGRAVRRSLLANLDPSRNRSELKARLDNLIQLKASGEVVKREQAAYKAAVDGKVPTDKEAAQEFERAKSTLENAINIRATSRTRQAQEATNRPSDQVQEATRQQAHQAQGTADHEGPRSQDLADPKANLLQEAADLMARHARESADMATRLAQVGAQIQAQEARDFEANRQQQVQPDEAARQDEIRQAKEREEKAEQDRRAEETRLALVKVEEA